MKTLLRILPAIFGSLIAGAAVAQTWTSIDYPGAAATAAFGINDRGDVVGRWDDVDGNVHGFLLRHGQFTSIDVPGGTFTAPRAVNDAGDVAGRWVDADGVPRGFVLRKGVFTSVDYPEA